MHAFVYAWSFLTRFPPIVTPKRSTPPGLPEFDDGAAVRSRALIFFPYIGAILALAVLVPAWLLGMFGISPELLALSVLLAEWIATGGLHWDGLADTLDGLSAGGDRQHALDVMRDSCLGAMGSLALIGGALAGWVALRGLFAAGMEAATFAVLLALVVSRLVTALAVAAFPYARRGSEGRGAYFTAAHPIRLRLQILLAALPLISMAAILFAYSGNEPANRLTALAAGLAILLGLAVPHVLAGFWNRRFGGLTGDMYGALCVISQLTVLLFLAGGVGG